MSEQTTTTTPAAALVIHEDDGLAMLFTASEATERLRALQEFVKSVMVRDEDFGVIPGTNKPTLYKPGAEKMAEIYGLRPEYEDVAVTEDWDRGFFYYRLRCRLFRGDRPIAEGVGSCNSKETKYDGRWAFDNEVPPDLDKSKLPKKRFFSSKKNKWYEQWRIPNAAIADSVNTILKMAKKRAYVDAVLTATRSSNLFTQDVEDFRSPVDEVRDRATQANEIPDADYEEAGAPPPPMSEAEFGSVCANWDTIGRESQKVQHGRMNPKQRELLKERRAQAQRNAESMKKTEPLPKDWGGENQDAEPPPEKEANH